jgi:hypothetical protein
LKHLSYGYDILDLALLEVVHVNVDAICPRVSFILDGVCIAAKVPSPNMPVDIMIAI